MSGWGVHAGGSPAKSMSVSMGTVCRCPFLSLPASLATRPMSSSCSMRLMCLVRAVVAPRKRPSSVRIDRAYGARYYRQQIQARGIRCICPERQDARQSRLRKGHRGGAPPRFDAQAYKGRNVVERAINRLKDFRAIATRYDKREHNYLAAVTIATIILESPRQS